MRPFIDGIIRTDLTQLHGQVNDKGFAASRYLVTGGAGFLGSWLCDFISQANGSVVCVDDLSTGLTDNIDHLEGQSNFKFQKADVTNAQFNGTRYQAIVHMASHASPEEYQKHPIETLTVNSVGTQNLLELARKNDSTFLYTSTSEVYGDPTVIPTPEAYWGNVSSIGPRSCYDEGKRFSEALCMAYHRTYGLDVRIVRIFNTYGPRLRADGFYGRALSRFIRQGLSGTPITVYGKGEQTRSFCYVTDTTRALLMALTEPKMKGELVNVGNPNEITILKLAEKIKTITKSNSKITFHPLPPHDPQRRSPVIARAKEILGWSPLVSLEEGLRRTINWFKEKKRSGSKID
jgi:UDP-glucuronate decarboxylase